MKNNSDDAQLLEFWNLLDMTAEAIERAREKELKKFNLSLVQSKVLISLWIMDHDPTIGELSHWLFREQSSTSCIAGAMEKRGLIRRYCDSARRSVTRIAITEEGEKEFHNVVGREILLHILSELSHEECRRIRDCFKAMLNHAIKEAKIRHSPIYAQMMVNSILKLSGGDSHNTGIVPDIQIEGINQGHLLLDIIYSYCTPDQLFVWVYIDQTRYAISRAIAMELSKYGLSLIQSKVLSTLTNLDHDPTLGELSGWLFREHNSVSGITDRMAKKGLLRKYQDPERKHLTRVAITEKGKQVHLDSVKKGDVTNVLSFLTPEDCGQVKSLLRRLFLKATAAAGLNTPAGFDKNGLSSTKAN